MKYKIALAGIALIVPIAAIWYISSGNPVEILEKENLLSVDASKSTNAAKFSNFYCIKLTNDLNTSSGTSTNDITEVRQLQHFINTYFYTRLAGLEENGIFGSQTAQKVAELKKQPHFQLVKNKSSLIDSETRKIISQLTCEESEPITVPVEFSISAFAEDGTRIIAPMVKEINTYVDQATIIPGAYGAYYIILDNPIDTKTLNVNLSKGNFFSGCDDTIAGMATLSKIGKHLIQDNPAGESLVMKAQLDALADIKIKEAVCGH